MRTLTTRRMLLIPAVLAILGCGGGGGGGGGPDAASPSTFPASHVTGLIQANSGSLRGPLTSDGRTVIFSTRAGNLVTGDTNNATDVFARDPVAGTTVRISVGFEGVQADSDSFTPSMSADGRYVSFISLASNLVSGDTNLSSDVFIRDRVDGSILRASVNSTGVQGNDICLDQAISADSRYVAICSYSSNLVAGDTNGVMDIFVRDRIAGTTSRVSVSSAGAQANSSSDNPAISADGRYVAFRSEATNLVAGDTNSLGDIFVRDTVAGTTTRVSVNSAEAQANGLSYFPSLSSDGRYVAFSSHAGNLVAGDTNTVPDIFVRDTVAGTTSRVSVGPSAVQGNGMATGSSISADGRYVAFASLASNLAGEDTNGAADIFIRDTTTGVTKRVSVGSGGIQADGECENPWISPDGRRVAYVSSATTLEAGDTNGNHDVFVTGVTDGTTVRASMGNASVLGDGDSLRPSISLDGRFVAFETDARNLLAGDTNGRRDVLLRDLAAGTSTLIAANSAGVQGNGESTEPAVSADGRYVAFVSNGTGLVAGDTNVSFDVFVRDVVAGTTSRVSVSSTGAQGNDHSLSPSISADGRRVAFISYASNLVPGDTNGYYDIFVRDREAGTTVRASVGSAGEQGVFGGYNPSISPGGRYVAYESLSPGLVAGDTNGKQDIFVRDLAAGTTVLASAGVAGVLGDGPAFNPSLSFDGRWVAFSSSATNLVAGDTNGTDDVFVRDLAAGTTTRASLSSSGGQAGGLSLHPKISSDGRFVAFTSHAADLIPSDTNSEADVFRRDLVERTTVRISIGSSGEESDGAGGFASISGDGRRVAFESSATNLVAGDANGRLDVFVRAPLH